MKQYMIVWWTNQVPMYATFDDEIQAAAAASVRNALLVEVDGKVINVLDYYRRDDAGNPMPAESRSVVPPLGMPWLVSTNTPRSRDE